MCRTLWRRHRIYTHMKSPSSKSAGPSCERGHRVRARAHQILRPQSRCTRSHLKISPGHKPIIGRKINRSRGRTREGLSMVRASCAEQCVRVSVCSNHTTKELFFVICGVRLRNTKKRKPNARTHSLPHRHTTSAIHPVDMVYCIYWHADRLSRLRRTYLRAPRGKLTHKYALHVILRSDKSRE